MMIVNTLDDAFTGALAVVKHKFPNATPLINARKLQEEAQELVHSLEAGRFDLSLEELADCFICLVGASGYPADVLAAAVHFKCAKILQRKVAQTADGTYKHVEREP